MSTCGIVIRCIGRGCQSANSQEIHCIKWGFCVLFAERFSGKYPWHKMRPACIANVITFIRL